MKCTIGMGLGAVICISSFVKTCSGIENLIRGMHRHTDSTVIT
jgi:hypothetical protein